MFIFIEIKKNRIVFVIIKIFFSNPFYVFNIFIYNIFYVSGQTCLHIAASSDQVELVRLLVHRGADLNTREGLAGRTALHLAMQYRCRSVIAFLLQECRFSLDTKTYRGETAYQLALHVDRQLARELVRLGAIPEPLPESDSNSSDEDESPAIIYISQA